MGKSIKLAVTCPKCSGKSPIIVTEDMLGTVQKCMCSTCGQVLPVRINESLRSKFQSDKTEIGSPVSTVNIVLEVRPSNLTRPQTFELSSDYYTIGRKNNGSPEHRADIEIDTQDMKMSRKHVGIRRKPVGFTLKDLGSKNGVKYQGQKLESDEEVYLCDGDEFVLGETIFKVSITGSSNNEDLTIS